MLGVSINARYLQLFSETFVPKNKTHYLNNNFNNLQVLLVFEKYLSLRYRNLSQRQNLTTLLHELLILCPKNTLAFQRVKAMPNVDLKNV
jgi:hypothetical protein